MTALTDEAIASPPATMAGAIACLEWARDEHLQFNMGHPDQGDRLILAMLEGALGVLRPAGYPLG